MVFKPPGNTEWKYVTLPQWPVCRSLAVDVFEPATQIRERYCAAPLSILKWRVGKNRLKSVILFFLAPFWFLTSLSPQKPEWCRQLPRPIYRTLQKIAAKDSWFEVYKIRPGVFAIYEPHQSEEVICYLVLGARRAVLFDTGMGISNIREVVEGLTRLPVSGLNSHTHNDHVGDNWRFTDIYGMDTDFTRTNAKGSKEDAQAEIAPGEVCAGLPPGFNPAEYATRPFQISHWLHDHDKIDLGGRILEVIATPGHTPDSIALLDEKNGFLFTGDTWRRGFNCSYPPTTFPSPNQARSRVWSRR
jgi:glyoxylase-like metal-dependent hydrolase (beta-lactamase superfamily II)